MRSDKFFDNSRFSTKKPGPRQPVPTHVDHRRQPHEKTLTRDLDVLDKSIERATKPIQRAMSLLCSYEERRAKHPKMSDLFFNPSPERQEQINFIMSIATSLSKEINSDISLRTIKPRSKQIDKMALPNLLILDGAFIYVSEQIAETYRNAWWSKDPNASQLFQETAARVGKKTNEGKVVCLRELQLYLQTKNAQATVSFGSEKTETVLAIITKQIDALSPSEKNPSVGCGLGQTALH